ncbi:LysM peptidoglycan-binding domain-containing protein [Paenibacillus wulumuqiensis]|uniref:LysM peptidoglycan-binding domain-containing protein n=1 Tax=Paenibacillus wulumuqiensis TaxID=1567107 RepID=UPI0006194647|nr:LysM peptidoglycan-binding domain-containing protein [Paenibacillus wulumuqiensis]
MEEYGFFLAFNNQSEAIRLPVNPEKIEINSSGDGKSYTIIDLGEINSIQPNKLREITLESFFPGQRYPFVVGKELQTPYYYVEMIQKWMETKRPIRFVFSGLQLPESALSGDTAVKNAKGEIERFISNETFMAINMAVSIEKFDWTLAAGDSGDIQFKLSLKEYVFYRALKVKIKKDKDKSTLAKKRTDTKVNPKTYKLVAGDSLWKIAKKQLGDGSRYKEIQKLNNIKDSELRKLPIGMVIKLPQKEAAQ